MTYFITFGVVSFLILFHEFGHFALARWIGMPVERFSIGVGPALWKRRWGGTEFRVSWIPFGGYVLPALKTEEDYFDFSIRDRIAFALGGPLANIALPVLFFAISNVITSGFSLYGVFARPFVQTGDVILLTANLIPMIFTEPGNLSGIIGVVAGGEAYVESGLLATLSFASMLSINLAVINLLPLPPLDGGRIVICLLERVHSSASRLHVPMSVAGWALVGGLLVYVTVLDIRRFLVGLI